MSIMHRRHPQAKNPVDTIITPDACLGYHPIIQSRSPFTSALSNTHPIALVPAHAQFVSRQLLPLPTPYPQNRDILHPPKSIKTSIYRCSHECHPFTFHGYPLHQLNQHNPGRQPLILKGGSQYHIRHFHHYFAAAAKPFTNFMDLYIFPPSSAFHTSRSPAQYSYQLHSQPPTANS